MSEDLDERSLRYHASEPRGKLAVTVTKPMATQSDLSLAYSPGVAAPCLAIARDASKASLYTARGNLIAVITNGTAVLGLGAIGALASKPVMEGKAALFKKFADIDVFDIEIEERDPQRFCDIVAGLEATFGGINLEDIKAPECFYIERTLRERLSIPVFHDDQHGTAIVCAAAVVSGLKVVGKTLAESRLVTSGAGAAALACLDLLVSMGLPKKNITVSDKVGVVYAGRTEEMDEYKARYARDTEARTLSDMIEGADIFLGLSAPNVLRPQDCTKMADKPLILALANPTPEIMPEDVKAVRPDAIVCTGRSDYPNQVNNVLCFPFIFRGALDVGATAINEEMKMACVHALSAIAESEPSDVVKRAYADQMLSFGPEYLLPKPFDPRLITEVSAAVARAAMESGVATRPIEDFRAYRRRLSRYVYRSSAVMEPIFERAREQPRRVVYGEGEDDRTLQAAQQIVDTGIAVPILIGREAIIAARAKELSLRMRVGENIQVVDPQTAPRLAAYSDRYYQLMARHGVSPGRAEQVVRSSRTVYAALMLREGDVDAMLCGTVGPFRQHLRRVREIIGKAEGVRDLSTLVGLILPHGTYFVCDTHITLDPSAEELAEMAVLSVDEVRRFGIEPKVALLSHSNFGTYNNPHSRKVRKAVRMLRGRYPELQIDGEMHGEAAISERIRKLRFPDARLRDNANLLVMPNMDAAHISYTLLKQIGGGVSVGPILLGAAAPIHILTESSTVRGIVNMTAYTVVQAQIREAAS
ncbi:MAG: NADP-dependent malic enzyme [Gammaproteobacteria bacterium]|nr:NADP-dependent malic enzyme [Gammaproteobacteria bacterium]